MMDFLGNEAFDYFFTIFAIITIPIAMIVAGISLFKD